MATYNDVAQELININWTFGRDKGVWDISSEHRMLCVLVDIAKSLRAIRKGIECHNVREGFVAMKATASLLRRRLPVKKKPTKKKKGQS